MHFNQISRSAVGHRVSAGKLMIVALLTGAFSSDSAPAQGTRTFMRGNDDGTHEIVHITSPDLDGLRKPEFRGYP